MFSWSPDPIDYGMPPLPSEGEGASPQEEGAPVVAKEEKKVSRRKPLRKPTKKTIEKAPEKTPRKLSKPPQTSRKYDLRPWLEDGKEGQAAYSAAIRHAKACKKALDAGKPLPPTPTGTPAEHPCLIGYKSKTTGVKFSTSLTSPAEPLASVIFVQDPWYLEDFETEGRRYCFDEERNLYIRWRKIPQDDKKRLTEKWDLFFELSRMSPAFFIHGMQLPIKTKAGPKVPFTNWHAGQRMVYLEIIAAWKDGKPVRLIVVKARQVGLSTLIAAILFWRAVIFPDVNATVMADKGDHSRNIRNMLGVFLAWMQDHLPQERFPQIASTTKSQIEWGEPRRDWQKAGKKKDTGKGPVLDSVYRCLTAASQINERSWTIHALHGSEVGFWKNGQANWLALSQAIADVPGTIIVMESSAQGNEQGEFFRSMWDLADRGESDFIPVFVGWQTQEEYKRDIPAKYASEADYIATYDEEERKIVARLHTTPQQMEWRRKRIANKCNGNTAQFRQEFPSNAEEAFLSGEATVYAPEALQHYIDRIREEEFVPAWVGEFSLDEATGVATPVPRSDGYLTVFREPEVGHTYCIGADPAEGHGGNSDSSVAQVLDADTLEQVAIYRSNVVPAEYFAKQVACLNRYYSDALVVPEANAIGGTMIFHLRNMNIEPMFVRVSVDAIVVGVNRTSQKYGFYTTPKSKNHLVELMGDAINNKKLVLHDRTTVKEISTYSMRSNGSYGPKKGAGHDDCHDALALALRGINSDQLVWQSAKSALGLRRAGDYLADARSAAADGRMCDVPKPLQGYFDPAFMEY